MDKRRLAWIPVWCMIAVLALTMGSLMAQEDDEGEEGREIGISDLPAAVQELIVKEAAGNKIEEVEMFTHGHVVFYEAEWMADGMEHEIQVAYLCKVVARSTEVGDDDEEGDDDEGDEGDDEEGEVEESPVSFNQLPQPVLEKIVQEAGKNRIVEMERILLKSGVHYEAEWIAEGWEVDLLLDPKGKVVRREMALCHDDDDDDDNGEDGDEEDEDDD